MSATTASTASTASEDVADFRLSPQNRLVFIGLMIGMFVSSVSQTIVGPAMPRIVAQLGGMDHYSWVATAAMLVTAVTVPIVGKLSDLYGRRAFYLGGLVVFMVGSVVSGLSTHFWMLILGRAIQGLGMGTLQPLSQTIIGDIIPPRQRGKYQGLMGTMFGVSSVIGPLAGGFITDRWGWRWLFFVALPFGLAAFVFLFKNLHLEHQTRRVKIDLAGMSVLTITLVAALLATSLGGSSFAWSSWQILGLYALATVGLVVFIVIERRAEEPVIPLGLFRSSIFTLANLASFLVSMVMFGAIFYVPVFAQGILGVSATHSSLLLMPMMIGLVVLGIISGNIITRTGSYKPIMIAGLIVLVGAMYLLTRLHYGSSATQLSLSMVVVGVGLGLCMQQYTLVVQNAATRKDLGVATASTQFFRNVGSTVGVAVLGTLMSSGLSKAIIGHLPPEAAEQAAQAGEISSGSVLDPAALAKLPPIVAQAIREGLADRLHIVFIACVPIAIAALLVTVFIKAIPLRTSNSTPEQSGKEMLDAMSQSTHDRTELVEPARTDSKLRTRERVLGLQLQALADQTKRTDRRLLSKAVTELGRGDLAKGRAILYGASDMFVSEDPAVAADNERYVAAIADAAPRGRGLLSPELRTELALAAAGVQRPADLEKISVPVSERHEVVDLERLMSAVADLSAAFAVDVAAAPDPKTVDAPRLVMD